MTNTVLGHIYIIRTDRNKFLFFMLFTIQVSDAEGRLGKICSYHHGGFAYVSRSNVMYVRFVSDESVTEKGFDGIYDEMEGKGKIHIEYLMCDI